MVDEDYDAAHQDDEGDYNGGRHSRKQSSSSGVDPRELYRLPADPWHIKIRWATDSMFISRIDINLIRCGFR